MLLLARTGGCGLHHLVHGWAAVDHLVCYLTWNGLASACCGLGYWVLHDSWKWLLGLVIYWFTTVLRCWEVITSCRPDEIFGLTWTGSHLLAFAYLGHFKHLLTYLGVPLTCFVFLFVWLCLLHWISARMISSMNWARVHAPVDQERLLKFYQWELLL